MSNDDDRPVLPRFIFLAVYQFDNESITRPVFFPVDFGARFLAFTEKELSLVLRQSGRNMFKRPVKFEESVIAFIFAQTGGHVGTNIAYLTLLQEKMTSPDFQNQSASSQDIINIYISRGIRHGLLSDLLVPNSLDFSCSEASIIKYLLCKKGRQCQWGSLTRVGRMYRETYIEAATALARRGIIAKIDGRDSLLGNTFGFASPILASMFCGAVFPPQTPSLVRFCKDDIEPFIDHVVSNFNYNTLKGTESAGAGTGAGKYVYRRALQMEFYRCALTAMGHQDECSPDVSYKYRSTGYIDFYVAGETQWGIEILRNNSQLHDHSEQSDNIYSQIPVRHRVLLNFVQLGSGVFDSYISTGPEPELLENETRVLWTSNSERQYRRCVLLRQDQPPTELRFAQQSESTNEGLHDAMRMIKCQGKEEWESQEWWD